MGTMKTGSGDDPFADDDGDTDTTDNSKETEEIETERQSPELSSSEDISETTDENNREVELSEPEIEPQSEPEQTSTSSSPPPDTPMQQTTTTMDTVQIVDEIPHANQRIPFIMSRDSVKGSRDGKTLQIALNHETQNYLEEAVRQLQREFDDDLKKMDISEAVLLAGLQNLKDVDSILKTWGYDFEQ